MAKAPRLARPVHNLASDYYEKNGEYEKALLLYKRALELESPYIINSNVPSLVSISNIYYRKGDYEKAAEYSHKALDADPKNIKARYNLTLSLIKTKKYTVALDNIDVLLKANPKYYDYCNLKGMILIHLKRYEEALGILNFGLQQYPDNINGLYYSGIAYRSSGDYKRADARFLALAKKTPGNVVATLALIENSLQLKNVTGTDQYLERLQAGFSINEIESGLTRLKSSSVQNTFDFETLCKKIKEKIPPGNTPL